MSDDRKTDPPGEPDTVPDELRPVLEAVDRVEAIMEEESRALRGALHALKTTVLEQYHAIQSRVDGHAERLERIEKYLELPPMVPRDG